MTRRWPLLLLALPAGVATWSGWVGLGELTGFGPVKPLPGISDFTINTAITLPIGVEAYAGYALHAWLSAREVTPGTRAFAKWSAFGSLLLGMLGQVAFHLLEVSGVTSAPWQVTTAVSCLPVLVLGMGAALGHMLARDAHVVPGQDAAVPIEAVEEATAPVTTDDGSTVERIEDTQQPRTPADVPAVPALLPAPMPVLAPVADELFPVAAARYADELAEGRLPPLSRLRTDLRIGQPRAQRVRTYLSLLAH